ncbi:MAG: extracellular solute-binding protein [Firmicutes bacterium]|nr:extracellular solute-binding protein [Bacillota bacterium]
MRRSRPVRGAVGTLAALGLMAAGTAAVAPAAQAKAPVTLKVLYMNQAGYTPAVVSKIVAQFNASHPGIHAVVTFLPYPEMHDAITTSAAAPTATYNVVLSDLIWTAEFAARGYTIPLNKYLNKLANSGAIPPAIWNGFKYDGKIMAMPFLANFQNFYYNKAILAKAGFTSPPRTMAQWLHQMEVIKAKGIVKYPYEDSWLQAEGLTCDYVRTAAEFGGTLFVDGKPAMNRGPALQALEWMHMLYAKGLAAPASLEADEPHAAAAFTSGQVAFNTNWTFVTGLMDSKATSSIVGDGVVAPFPTYNGQGSGSVSGYQGLAITANTPPSLRPAAWTFIQYATSPAIIGQHLQSEWPIWRSLANSPQEKAILGARNVAVYEDNLAHVQNRPIVPNYLQVSAIIQKYVHMAIAGQMPVKQAADAMVQQIEALPAIP